MINYSWQQSFARVETNQEAICDRGWYPCNRNCLLHKDLCVTMTSQDVTDESMLDDCIEEIIDIPKLTYTCTVDTSTHTQLNFTSPFARNWLSQIVRETDLVEVREQIKKIK